MINNHNFGNQNFGNPSFGMGNQISPQTINLANPGSIPYMQ